MSDRGSIPLALLAIIVIGALTAVVVASTIAGERSTRFDEDFTGALHVAEAGITEASFKLNTGQIAPDANEAHSDPDSDEGYKWDAVNNGDHWVVTSTGEVDGVSRTIRTRIEDSPLFESGAFTDQQLTFGGTVNADSYRSDGNDAPDDWCTGAGRVGSNVALEFGGQGQGQATCDYDNDSATVDGVDLYDWDGNPDPDRCDHNVKAPNNCWNDAGENEPRFETHDDPLVFDSDVGWMEDLITDCEDSGDLIESFRSSDHNGVIDPANLGDAGAVKVEFQTGHGPGPGDTYAYCVGELVFDGNTEVTGNRDDPVVFVVRDHVVVGEDGRVAVNCTHNGGFCDTSGNPDVTQYFPDAAALQMYTPSASNPDPAEDDVLKIAPHSMFAGAVYAPNGGCGSGGSQVQVHVFGALVCENLDGQGGWQFHYDEALSDAVTTGEFGVTRWSESE